MRNRKNYRYGYQKYLFSEENLRKVGKLIKQGKAHIDMGGYSGPWWMIRIFEGATPSECGALLGIADFRKLYNQRAPLKGIKSLEKGLKKAIRGSRK